MVYDSSLGFIFSDINPTQWNGWRTYTLRGEVNDGNAWYANAGVSGAAGLFATVDDLQNWLICCWPKARPASGSLSVKIQWTCFLQKTALKWAWLDDGQCQRIYEERPAGSFGHTGFTGTSIAVVPSLNLSVILLINRQNTGLLATGEYFNTNPIRQQVFKAVLDYCQ